jgi:phosphoribosylformylglycinamidine synthase
MLAGGVGRCRPQTALKAPGSVAAGSYAVVLGGPAMLIGLGGGAASSRTSSDQDTELDFQSVQRGSPEVQRRAHELIQACLAMGVDSPIKFIHGLFDVSFSKGP